VFLLTLLAFIKKTAAECLINIQINRADLLEVYKMASGKSGISLHDLFTVDKNGKTSGHSLKLIKKYSKGNI